MPGWALTPPGSHSAKDVPIHEDPSFNKPSVLKTLDLKWEREIFLDTWYDYGPTARKLYLVYYKQHNKQGKDMIRALEEYQLQLFIEIFAHAEKEAQRRYGR